MTCWNRGLTKEDPRVDANSEGLRKWSRSEEGRKFSSLYMKKYRENGVIPSLYGPDHPQWKNGITSLHIRARNSLRSWRDPIRVRDGFKCRECGSTENLEVNHDIESFSQILNDVRFRLFPDHSYILSWEEETKVAEAVVDYHIQTKVSGQTLCQECHKIFHRENRRAVA